MKKILFILLCSLFCISIANAQEIYTRSDFDNPPAYSVNDMKPNEIRFYNYLKRIDCDDTTAVLTINAGRAWLNLKNAPATIIQTFYEGVVGERDSVPHMMGAQNVWFLLINSTVKTIKEITIKLDFKDEYGNTVYDTKTGNEYITLKFKGLAGRCASASYFSILPSIHKCISKLTLKKATYCTPFYNENCRKCRIASVSIIYEDGTKTNKYSIYKGDYSLTKKYLFNDGPLRPIAVKQ